LWPFGVLHLRHGSTARFPWANTSGCELFPQKTMLMSPGLAALHRRKALDGLGGLEAEGFCKTPPWAKGVSGGHLLPTRPPQICSQSVVRVRRPFSARSEPC
jgi:hypothetical protein